MQPCTPTTVTVDPSVQKYLPFWPLPNGGIQSGSNGDIGIFTFPAQQVVKESFFTTRVDNNISDRDSLAATYLGDITPYSSPDGLDATMINSKTNRQIAALEETHIFSPSLVNTARIGYSREGVLNSVPVTAINPLAKDPSLAAEPGQFATGVNVHGIASFAGGLLNDLTYYFLNSLQVYDDAFWSY